MEEYLINGAGPLPFRRFFPSLLTSIALTCAVGHIDPMRYLRNLIYSDHADSLNSSLVNSTDGTVVPSVYKYLDSELRDSCIGYIG